MVINTIFGPETASATKCSCSGGRLHADAGSFLTAIQCCRTLCPTIFDGMKVSIALIAIIVGVTVAGFVISHSAGSEHLYLLFANGQLDTTMMMAAIVVLSVMSASRSHGHRRRAGARHRLLAHSERG